MNYDTFLKIAKLTGAVYKSRYDSVYKHQYYKARKWHPFIIFSSILGLLSAMVGAIKEIHEDLNKELWE